MDRLLCVTKVAAVMPAKKVTSGRLACRAVLRSIDLIQDSAMRRSAGAEGFSLRHMPAFVARKGRDRREPAGECAEFQGPNQSFELARTEPSDSSTGWFGPE
jgi:hypothetical protein